MKSILFLSAISVALFAGVTTRNNRYVFTAPVPGADFYIPKFYSKRGDHELEFHFLDHTGKERNCECK